MKPSAPAKEPAAEPEIPDELRSKISRPHRPAGYKPKSEEAEDDNAPEEKPKAGPLRDLTLFWKQLAARLKKGDFTRVEIRERTIRKKGQPARVVKEPVHIPVELNVGADGLPFPAEAVDAAEARRIRGLNYADAPKQDPGFGDLTPDFVEWLWLNHPYDAAVRYYARKTHVQIDALNRV